MRTDNLTLENVCSLLTNGVASVQKNDLLENSLFYYCCGKDATPVVAFGGEYPLYVYSDSFSYVYQDFASALNVLYDRIKNARKISRLLHRMRKSFELIQTARVSVPQSKNAEVSMWKDPSGRTFFIAYIQGYAADVFEYIYKDRERDHLFRPRCICNFRYEDVHWCTNGDASSIYAAEERVQYILGECRDDKYEIVDKFKYYGDYGDLGCKVPLFRKKHGYVE